MLDITYPAPNIGAIIKGVNINHVTEAEFEHIYQTWLERSVICVRDQNLDMSQFLTYCRRFGRVKPHLVTRTRHRDYPEITVMGVDKLNADGTPKLEILKRGVGWHTDLPWDQDICKGTQLYAVAIPSHGGDTLFTNMYMAWNQLPTALKRQIRHLKAEFIYGGRRKLRNAILSKDETNLPPAVHPLVRVHEETQRTSLYLNPYHVLGIHGFEQQASDQLLETLFPHLVVEDAQYRHVWQAGDVVIWDNRCCMHSATGDYPIEEDRIHWRVTIMHDHTDKQCLAS